MWVPFSPKNIPFAGLYGYISVRKMFALQAYVGTYKSEEKKKKKIFFPFARPMWVHFSPENVRFAGLCRYLSVRKMFPLQAYVGTFQSGKMFPLQAYVGTFQSGKCSPCRPM